MGARSHVLRPTAQLVLAALALGDEISCFQVGIHRTFRNMWSATKLWSSV